MNFIFIHIPRCGGSAITKALRQFGQFYSFGNHVSANQTKDRVGIETFENSFTFSIVRNPFERLVSLYRYICRDSTHHLHKNLIQYKSFVEFVSKLRLQHNCLRDTQCSYVQNVDGENLVDFVGRFENLEEDFRIICKKIGVEASLGIKPDIPKYQDWYDKTAMRIVDEVYAKDLETFDYEF